MPDYLTWVKGINIYSKALRHGTHLVQSENSSKPILQLNIYPAICVVNFDKSNSIVIIYIAVSEIIWQFPEHNKGSHRVHIKWSDVLGIVLNLLYGTAILCSVDAVQAQPSQAKLDGLEKDSIAANSAGQQHVGPTPAQLANLQQAKISKNKDAKLAIPAFTAGNRPDLLKPQLVLAKPHSKKHMDEQVIQNAPRVSGIIKKGSKKPRRTA